MSDYSKTYAKTTGDDINASDFSTEFDAIQVAIASKADHTGDTITTPTIDQPTFTNWQGGDITSNASASLPAAASVDLTTTVPTWVTRITVTLANVSTTGTNTLLCQVGTGGAATTSGYNSSLGIVNAGGTGGGAVTGGFALANPAAASSTHSGMVTITRHGANTSNTWICESSVSIDGVHSVHMGSGIVTLAGDLDTVTLTTGGAPTFDNGSAAVMWE